MQKSKGKREGALNGGDAKGNMQRGLVVFLFAPRKLVGLLMVSR